MMLAQMPSILFLVLCAGPMASGHMILSYPPALRGANNPYSGSDVDSNLNAPVTSSNFPCKGSLSLLGTKEATSVATWTAGEAVNMTISGGAPHGGGSCQASVSYDSGKTFTVLHSFEGGCPGTTGTSSSFNFNVPSDAPAAKSVIFSWNWFNREGNREMYNNCAVVDVMASSSSSSSEKVAFGDRPATFTANTGIGCTTADSTDLKFPNPGSDVATGSSSLTAPVGSSCQQTSGGSSSSTTTSSSGTYGDDAAASTAVSAATSSSAIDASGSGSSSSAGSDSGASSQPDAGSWTPGNDFPENYSASHSLNVYSSVAFAVVFAGAVAIALQI